MMAILDHPDAQILLDDAVLSVEQVERLAERLEPFLARYFPLFQRQEQRDNARLILLGKLSALSRKTCEPIAHFFGTRRENLQDFVGSSPWSDRVVLDEIRRHVSEAWADPQGVLIGDGSGFAKKGEHSCGVKRQYCGRLGKVENCQVGVFLGYSCRHGRALLGHRLFLPPEWADDADRRRQAGVPEHIVYKETWEILLEELDLCVSVAHEWFVADSEFGRVNAFRGGLRQRQQRYIVAVRSDLRMRDLRERPPARAGDTGRFPLAPIRSAQEWAAMQPAAAWQRFKIRDAEKGELTVESIETEAQTFEDSSLGSVERLVVMRTVGQQEQRIWYCLSNAGEEVPLRRATWAYAQRFWVEAMIQDGKSEVGLDEYEVRSWRGWHHHMTLSLLAVWLLALLRGEESEKTPR